MSKLSFPLILLSCLVLNISTSARAVDSIPNANFDYWSSGEPDNWSTSNTLGGGLPTNVTQASITDRLGPNTVKLETASTSNNPLAGVVSTGDTIILNNTTFDLYGFDKINLKPIGLTGVYKYSSSGNDKAQIKIETDTGGGLVGECELERSNLYQKFTCPIDYSLIGDSLRLTIYSSVGIGVENSKLFVDSLAYTYEIRGTISKTAENVLTSTKGSATITIDAQSGVPPYSYSWAHGGTTNVANDLIPGTYTCTVTDSIGNSKVFSTIITSVPYEISGTITNTPENVLLSTLGSATVIVDAQSGVPPFAYSWAHGGTTNIANDLPPGTYTCTVNDSLGKSKNFSTTITSVPYEIGGTISSTQIDCQRESIGSVTVTIDQQSGVPPFTYSWAHDNGTLNIADNLTYGTYSCTVSDSKSKTKTFSVFVDSVILSKYNICYVTYDSASGHNLIIWDPIQDPIYGGLPEHLILYKESATGENIAIDTIITTNSNKYIDYTSDPNIGVWNYKFGAQYKCGIEVFGNTMPSLYLELEGSGDHFNLRWSGYVHAYGYYGIMRDEEGSGNFRHNGSKDRTSAGIGDYGSYPNARYYVYRNYMPPLEEGEEPCYTPQVTIRSNVLDLANPNTTGLESYFRNPNFSIHPNPFYDQITIDIDENSIVDFYDVLGNLILSKSVNSGTTVINTTILSHGVYFVTVSDSKSRSTKKIVKQ